MHLSNWQLIGFQLLVVVPFLMGSILNSRIPRLSSLAKTIVILNLTIIEPPIVLWSIWGLALRGEMILLPLAGLFMVITGFSLGKLMTPLLPEAGDHRKVFVISASLSNHGFTMGGMLGFLLLGEKGLALSAIFITYFVPYTFLFIFFYANMSTEGPQLNLRDLFRFLCNIRNMPLLAVLIAIGLKLGDIDRPTIIFPIHLLLAISIALYYFALGINFERSDIRSFSKEQGLLAVIKFILIPLLTVVLIQPFDLSTDIRTVILMQAFMPVAVYAVMTAILFNLNIRLASSLFIGNTIVFLAALLPAVLLLAP